MRRLDEELLLPDVRRSADRLGRLLAEEFIEFASSGRIFDKVQIIETLQHEPSDPTRCLLLSEFSARHLAPGIVLATYRTFLSSLTRPRATSRAAPSGVGPWSVANSLSSGDAGSI
ncbi:MAG: nuclear transport factor 2 family protein [Hyphomicrobiaceae bacterium]|nr:nuclear transport factor 2 family protein [Hyphomicrobiaceae bacterium]